ncbi:hypothetical protein NDA01_21755 [Trichocoleus desertorum AS-A10]|uniref:hypothetical protein n=1 Tax=Trichocoleus desertorum TaxID=1481672 RepID=UPI003297D99C
MTTLADKLNLLHFDESTFRFATKNQSGVCCLCCLSGTRTFAPTRLVIKTRTQRGRWPDRYLCSICTAYIAKTHLGVKQVLVGDKILAEQLLSLNLNASEEEEAIVGFLISSTGGKGSLTAGQLKLAIGDCLKHLSPTDILEICQRLCDRGILKQIHCGHYDRYSLAEELAHAS